MKVPFLDVGAQNRMVRPELDAAYRRVMESGNYILGQEVDAFEREWAAYCGYKHCVGVASGFDALRLILMAYGIGEGDEVIVPSNTYIATWLAVAAVGAKVVPVEPEQSTFTMDARDALAAVTPKTAAILAVHLYGNHCDTTFLWEIAESKHIPFLVDAAQGHGIKELGDAAGFSFYPTKNLGCLGDGGAVVTNNPFVADKIRALRNYGSKDRQVFSHEKVANSRLDELQAAFLRAKLPRLDAWNRRRAHAASSTRSTDENRLYSDSVNHLCVKTSGCRDAERKRLLNCGVETAVHYPVPPHLQPAFADSGFRIGQFPIAEWLAQDCYSVPCGPELSDEEIAHVVSCLDSEAVAA